MFQTLSRHKPIVQLISSSILNCLHLSISWCFFPRARNCGRVRISQGQNDLDKILKAETARPERPFWRHDPTSGVTMHYKNGIWSLIWSHTHGQTITMILEGIQNPQPPWLGLVIIVCSDTFRTIRTIRPETFAWNIRELWVMTIEFEWHMISHTLGPIEMSTNGTRFQWDPFPAIMKCYLVPN